jgi:hypothetical protein
MITSFYDFRLVPFLKSVSQSLSCSTSLSSPSLHASTDADDGIYQFTHSATTLSSNETFPHHRWFCQITPIAPYGSRSAVTRNCPYPCLYNHDTAISERFIIEYEQDDIHRIVPGTP